MPNERLEQILGDVVATVREIPQMYGLVFSTLKEYHLFLAIKQLTGTDEQSIGESVENGTIPSDALIFRGTNLERYRQETVEQTVDDTSDNVGTAHREGAADKPDTITLSNPVLDLWWTFNLTKAANYARKTGESGGTPLVLVGRYEDIAGFKPKYTDDAIFLQNQTKRYKRVKALMPLYETRSSGVLSLPILVGFKEVT